jgi:hypothetical protein
MTRRAAKPAVKRKETGDAASRPSSLDHDEQGEARSPSYVGERIRRIALGLTAALLTARAYWPSEPDVRVGAGGGLFWVLAVLFAAGLGFASSFVGGRFRWRWSWADLALAVLVVLVAYSANHALDRRPAINLAWEWVGLGVMYFLVRNLPRTAQESSALTGAMLATAVAVSVYGLYQAKVELPELQRQFQRNPREVLQTLGFTGQPGSREEMVFRDRLLNSNEVFSTFALANSLAGFIVGPLVIALAVAFQNLVLGDLPGSRWRVLGMAAPPLVAMLVCLILTKSISSWVGLCVAISILGWEARKRVPARVVVWTGMAGVVIVGGLALGALAAGRLDRGLLAQAARSLHYRWQYWQGTWGVLTDGAGDLKGAFSAPALWWGVGPGNFAGPYLRHKLAEASEAIQDPHNLFLDVWATAGLMALVALVAALGLGLRDLLGPAGAAALVQNRQGAALPSRRARRLAARAGKAIGDDEVPEDDWPPKTAGWLVAASGAGWALVLLVGDFNLFKSDLFSRWLILGAGWLAAILLGGRAWRRVPTWVAGIGAAVVAIVVNLLAAGGIGIPTVAIGLWMTMALGLNQRQDRACGQLREFASRMPAAGLAVAWAAVVGTFFGLVMPFWRAEAAMAQADDASRRLPPDFDRAEGACKLACASDRFYSRPWLQYAVLYENDWLAHGAKPKDDRLKKIEFLLDQAVSPPRNPSAWAAHREHAAVLAGIMSRIGPQLDPREAIGYQAKIAAELRRASRCHPTNATLHAELAEASANISMYRDAAVEAEEALRLDRITPHPDKKLVDEVRARLIAHLPEWKERSAQNANLDAKP